MSKIKEALEDWYGLEFYENADVKKTKKSKSCDVCGGNIPSGSSHLGFRFYGNDGDWPVFVVCNKCEIDHLQDLHLIEEFKK